jgi:hypothetical protein
VGLRERTEEDKRHTSKDRGRVAGPHGKVGAPTSIASQDSVLFLVLDIRVAVKGMVRVIWQLNQKHCHNGAVLGLLERAVNSE